MPGNCPTATTGTNEDKVVADKICIVVALNLIDEWRFVGLSLGLEAHKLDELKKRYNTYGVCEVAYKMLHAWKDCKDEQATVKALATALREQRRTDLATKILQMAAKCTTTATPENLPANIDKLSNATLFQIISKDFGIDWRFLGRYLEVEETLLDELERQDNDIFNKAQLMLEKWTKTCPPTEVTATHLVTELREMCRNDLVAKIVKEAAKIKC